MSASHGDSSATGYEYEGKQESEPESGSAMSAELCQILQHVGTSPGQTPSLVCPSLLTLSSGPDIHVLYPWTRWVESLRSKKHRGPKPSAHVDGWLDGSPAIAEEGKEPLAPSIQGMESRDQMSGCSSSILGRVKTASLSIQTSSEPKSRTNTITSNSIVPSRRSVESTQSTLYSMMSHGSRLRAVKRRHILREIYSSEANYVHGLQTLVQILSAYLTMRPAIIRDLQRLFDMHDSFKRKLETVSPQSVEVTPLGAINGKPRIIQKIQSRPLLARNLRRVVGEKSRKDWADPSEALLVAMEIDRLTSGFGLYESFVRTFDILAEDLTILRQSRPADGFWAEGIEALSKSVDSTQRRKENGKKSLTVDDLMAKPVQRVCKYRLLLSELLKTIPESEYPLAHSKIKAVLEKNVEAVDRINTVVGNPNLRMRIAKTIALHERLEYDNSGIVENVYQDLGPLILCGVLHVAYSSPNSVNGQYLACILFSSYILLAKPRNDTRRLTLVASIYLLDMTVDTLMNGQGVACLDTPFSWKVVFQHNKNRHELILSASSAAEERIWKTEILKASVTPPDEPPTLSLEARRFSFLSIPLKTVENDDRSLLLSRTASLRSFSSHQPLRTQQRQIIVKKTHNPVYDNEVRQLQESDLTRSGSVAKSNVNSPTVLLPLRWSRVKLERSIGDIFSHELLPYPGMTLGGADYLQTQSMMRRSIIRGISLRGVFSSRRSASLGKASALSIDDGEEIKNDEQDDNAGDVSNERQAISPASDEPITERPRAQSTDPKASQSIRRRVARATSDTVTGRPRSSWKRWPPSLSGFSLFNSRRSSSK
ncbi:Rac guanine nucleotide exchange factor JJ [Talaromyces islandicus]|uniref:Rac guanine nucleotide exchange factor JJ n=1 Tax=Talaromyces islandicus TaxID=28573 RepID=A0A0U1M6A1_TALIS|nr:Rac guanine nucleotide exchange factor JJ [Talaromyces islandicus]